ncbi:MULTISPECIES: hypothetical protein [Oerskovia]|uniref:Sigma-70 family RNA polymerase sigma factor n=2 Tax=Oerskovia TaxID=162491 RepID=A0ABR8V591_9CELL|nr:MULTISPECIES: hypothetical protein [Oerskovia]MBD7999955.1 hypothetical protein [Oerskovia gallyi]MBM7496301.1 hypothetical protein [Oerskovia paurometabola]
MNVRPPSGTCPDRARAARSLRAAEEPLLDDDHDAPSDAMRSEVARIVQLGDDTRYGAEVSSFIAGHRDHWRRIAARLCRTNSVPVTQHLEDVEAIVTETVWEMLERSRQDPTYLSTMRSFLAIVVYTARPKVRSFVDHATAPASGMVSAQRRRRELARTRAELAALRGTVPTVQEAVQAANDRLGAHRSDVVRQGMVVTEADELVLSGTLSFDETLDSPRLVQDDHDCVLHPVEAPTLVRSVVDAAQAENPTRGKVAALWMAEAYGSGPLPGQDTVVWISRTLGLPRRSTAAHIDRVRELAAARLHAMGIGTDLLESA